MFNTLMTTMEKNKPQNEQIEVPSDMEIICSADELYIVFPWDTRKNKWGIWAITIFWNGFVLFLYIMAFIHQIAEFVLFGTIHLLIGMYFILFALGSIYNKVSIKVTAQGIEMKNTPIYLPFMYRTFFEYHTEINKIYYEIYRPILAGERPHDILALTVLTPYERHRIIKHTKPAYVKAVAKEISRFLAGLS